MSAKAQTYLPAICLFDRLVEQMDARAWRG